MKYLTFLFIVILNKNFAQERLDTIPKYKTNSIGVSICSNYTIDFNENVFNLFAQHNNIYGSIGCSYTSKINESDRLTNQINLIGFSINLGANLHYFKDKLTIPIYIYYNSYSHKFSDANRLNSNLYLSNKGIKIGGQYNFNKINLSPYVNIGINYLQIINRYTEYDGTKHGTTKNLIGHGPLPLLEIGVKYNFYKSCKNKNRI